jgi:hypothetical protein
MDDPEAEVGYQLAAIRVLVSEGLASTIRDMERDQSEEEARRDRVETAVALVLEHHPDISYEDAERFMIKLVEFTEPEDLTSLLEEKLGFWKPPEITDEVIRRLWSEVGLSGDPGPEPAPAPAPRCGFRELPAPAPAPDPDREYLQAQAVELERQRREQVKHPGQVPPAAPPAAPPAKVQVVTTEQEARYQAERDRQERDRQDRLSRSVVFADLLIDPFGGL